MKAKVHTRFSIKHKMFWIGIAIGVVGLVIINIVWFATNLFVKNDIRLQSPLQSPIYVTPRKDKIIIKTVVATPTPTPTPTKVPEQSTLY